MLIKYYLLYSWNLNFYWHLVPYLSVLWTSTQISFVLLSSLGHTDDSALGRWPGQQMPPEQPYREGTALLGDSYSFMVSWPSFPQVNTTHQHHRTFVRVPLQSWSVWTSLFWASINCPNFNSAHRHLDLFFLEGAVACVPGVTPTLQLLSKKPEPLRAAVWALKVSLGIVFSDCGSITWTNICITTSQPGFPAIFATLPLLYTRFTLLRGSRVLCQSPKVVSREQPLLCPWPLKCVISLDPLIPSQVVHINALLQPLKTLECSLVSLML